MNQPSAIDAVFYVLVLILPLSALVARQLPIASVAKMAAGWIAIFAVLLILVGQKERFRPLWDGARGALTSDDQLVTGGTVRIPMAEDGHFWARVRLNGLERRMLVDSGATTTALSAATARAANVAIDADAPGVMLNTANGTVNAARATLGDMRLGDIVAHDLPVVVSKEFGEGDVLGMNFLSRLRAWRVEGRTLVLEPKQS